MTYYQLTQTPALSGLYMTREPDLGPWTDWLSGRPHEDDVEVPTPLEVELDSQYGKKLGDYLDDSLPIVSDRMLQVLRDVGVDNFDAYAVVLVDPEDNARHEGYWAIQVIGRIAAADLDKSDVSDPLGVGHTALQFRELALDESRAMALPLFRLHESVSTILVSESVKVALESAQLELVSLVKVGDKARPALDE